MKATLSQEAMRIATVVDTSITREALNCVKIGNGEILATDGFLLVRKPTKTEGDGEILVKAADILKARRAGGRKLETLSLTTEGDVTVEIKSDKPEVSVTGEALRANFPAYDQSYPTDEVKTFIALDTRLLAKMIKAIGMNTIVKLRIRAPSSPVEFVAGDVSGLIMPMFASVEDEHWHKEKE